METITPVLSPSPDIPGQLVYHLPERFGTGIVTSEKFSSGLSLVYMNLRLTQPVRIMGETAEWNFGVSFNLSGYAEVYSSKCRRIAAMPGSSVHYAYPGLQEIEENIGVTHRSKISVLSDSETLLNLANGDEEPFLPFLQGYQNENPVTGQEIMVTEMKKALYQLIFCPYRGKTRTLYIEGKMMEVFASRLEQPDSSAKPQRPCPGNRHEQK